MWDFSPFEVIKDSNFVLVLIEFYESSFYNFRLNDNEGLDGNSTFWI